MHSSPSQLLHSLFFPHNLFSCFVWILSSDCLICWATCFTHTYQSRVGIFPLTHKYFEVCYQNKLVFSQEQSEVTMSLVKTSYITPGTLYTPLSLWDSRSCSRSDTPYTAETQKIQRQIVSKPKLESLQRYSTLQRPPFTDPSGAVAGIVLNIFSRLNIFPYISRHLFLELKSQEQVFSLRILICFDKLPYFFLLLFFIFTFLQFNLPPQAFCLMCS